MDIDLADSWELRRPDLLLRAVAVLEPFDRPMTLLVRVDGPEQRLGGVRRLWEEPPVDEQRRTRMTEQALDHLGFGLLRVPYEQWPMVVAVVVRPGPVWWSQDEIEVALGLRYGSNLRDVRQGDILTVGARGWYCQLDELAGTHPRAAWA